MVKNSLLPRNSKLPPLPIAYSTTILFLSLGRVSFLVSWVQLNLALFLLTVGCSGGDVKSGLLGMVDGQLLQNLECWDSLLGSTENGLGIYIQDLK